MCKRNAALLHTYRHRPQSLSMNVAVNCTHELDVSLIWLITGKGDMFMKNNDQLATRIETTYFKEASELLGHMKKNPLIRYSVLTHFQKLKNEEKREPGP